MTALAPSSVARLASTTAPRDPVLMIGSLKAPMAESVWAAASQALLPVVAETSPREAERWLSENRPACIVVDLPERAAKPFCLQLRYDPELSNVPLVVLADEVRDLTFAEAYTWGVDDVCARGDADALGRRMRGLVRGGEVARARKRGTAVVADPDRRGRVLTARALRNAGWGVAFAADAEEAIAAARGADVELCVCSATLELADPKSLLARAREAGASCPWIIAATPRETSRVNIRTAGLDRVAVYDAFGPPENVLFVANDLMRGAGPDARSSARLLYGTSVRFRSAGGDQDDTGFTYNVSAGGLYVRTLAPLSRGAEAWLELTPPRCDRRVRLEGRVVWSRRFGPNDTATVPPGFGVQILGGSSSDLERWARGYQGFASELSA